MDPEAAKNQNTRDQIKTVLKTAAENKEKYTTLHIDPAYEHDVYGE